MSLQTRDHSKVFTKQQDENDLRGRLK